MFTILFLIGLGSFTLMGLIMVYAMFKAMFQSIGFYIRLKNRK